MSRRLAGVPLQHVEGTVEFRDLVLTADPRAFIPRPETEQLVERIAAWARGRGVTDGVWPVRRPNAEPPLGTALDVGTGSGAIALSLVHERIAGRVLALERSIAALEQATENRDRIGLTTRQVELRQVAGPIWSAVEEDRRFDLIVSNPPYVADEEMELLPPEVRRDPREALSGGEDGLEVVRELLAEAWERLNPGGGLFLEIGETQGDQVSRLLTGAGVWARQEIAQDLSGRVRFAFAERPEPSYTGRLTPDAPSGR
jgi:release factor glutamine methyltransferase